MFSYNITWGATKKEVERSNFFKEVPKIFKRYVCFFPHTPNSGYWTNGLICRFWFPLLVSSILVVGIIIVATPLVPVEWRIGSDGWAVIFPLAWVVRSWFPLCYWLETLRSDFLQAATFSSPWVAQLTSSCAPILRVSFTDYLKPMAHDFLILISPRISPCILFIPHSVLFNSW